MKRPLLLLLLLPALAACDARGLAGPAEPARPTPRTTADVKYQVEGTYATCKIVHTDPSKGLVSEEDVLLPWTKTFRVTVNERTGPFDANVIATCLDPTKIGKSTVRLFIDGEEMRRDSNLGPGATSAVSFTVGRDA